MDAREVFVAVVEHRSFTAAANQLGVSTSYASRSVRELEERLGVALFTRSTRKVRVTEAGREYHAQVAPLLRGLEEADLVASAHRVEPRGLLRVAMPNAFGRRWVLPTLLSFQERWPEVQVEAQLSDRFTDPLAVDVSIRGGSLPEPSGLMAWRLSGYEDLLAASPAFLERVGPLSHPDDLQGLPGCIYTGYGRPTPWRLTRGQDTAEPEVSAVFRSDAGEALMAAATRGFGLVLQPDFLVGPLIAEGALVRVLPDWGARTGNLWAVTPTRLVPATVRAFLDAMREDLAQPGWRSH